MLAKLAKGGHLAYFMVGCHDQMTESEFLNVADGVLETIQTAVEDAQLEVDLTFNAGVLQMAFDNGANIVINRHTPKRELWIAAREGGFHFAYHDGLWLNTRDHSELFKGLAGLISAAVQHPFQFEK